MWGFSLKANPFHQKFTGKFLRTGLLILLAACTLLLGGCTLLSEEKVKLRDLEFTVLGEEKIPEQLTAIIAGKKKEPFQITYTAVLSVYMYRVWGAGDGRLQHCGE